MTVDPRTGYSEDIDFLADQATEPAPSFASDVALVAIVLFVFFVLPAIFGGM